MTALDSLEPGESSVLENGTKIIRLRPPKDEYYRVYLAESLGNVSIEREEIRRLAELAGFEVDG